MHYHHRVIIFVLTFCGFFLPQVSASTPAAIYHAELSRDKQKISLVFHANAKIRYNVSTLQNPFRLVIDFQDVILKHPLHKLILAHTPIRSLRYDTPRKNNLQVILELAAATQVKVFSVPTDKPPYRVELDFMNQLATVSTTIKPFVPQKEINQKPAMPLEKKIPMPTFSNSKINEKNSVATVLKQNEIHRYQPKPVQALPRRQASTTYSMRWSPNKRRIFTVALDAGHGGKDSGATGRRGTREKDVVLHIARILKSHIDRVPGMRAVLTRQGDYYISLRHRLNLARRHNSDLFISIHADAYRNQQSRGASVFALSQRGATSEAARWLAEKENYSELGGVSLDGLDDKSGLIRSVLIDLSQTATIGASLQLGQSVLGNLNYVTALHHPEVEQARFVVLKSPDIPSILIETGFITNPYEENRLRNNAYCHRIAAAIFAGVHKYVTQNPSMGRLS